MRNCKKALVESNVDYKKPIQSFLLKDIIIADKRSNRNNNERLIYYYIDSL
jgi:translation elongation factor EF-Ts